MAEQNLSAPAKESNTPQPQHHPIVSYTSKDGRHVDLDTLRTSLEIIADDIDVEEAHARAAGDIALAETLNAIFYDVDGLIPVAGQSTGGAV